MTAVVSEVQVCIAEARRGLRLGPSLPGRLAMAGPADVLITGTVQEPIVTVRLNGVLGSMAVSSNEDFTAVTTAYAKRAGLRIVDQSPQVPMRVRGALVAVPYARARALEVGEASVEALDIVVHDELPMRASVDGVLGKGFLSHFRTSIDMQGRRLKLEPRNR